MKTFITTDQNYLHYKNINSKPTLVTANFQEGHSESFDIAPEKNLRKSNY